MSDASVDLSQAGTAQPDWQDYVGKRVLVYALYGAYAFKRAPTVLRVAERAAEALTRLLKPADMPWGDQITIYLTDPIVTPRAGAPPEADGGDGQSISVESISDAGIVWIVQPEAPDDPLIWTLTRLLVARWFGPGAALAIPFLDGLAGLVAAR